MSMSMMIEKNYKNENKFNNLKITPAIWNLVKI